MTDYPRKKIWQNPHNLAGDIRKNPEITIDCFPYGVADNTLVSYSVFSKPQ